MPIIPPGDGGGGDGPGPGRLSVSPAGPYNFGSVSVGSNTPLVLTVTNVGLSNISVVSVAVGGLPYVVSGLPALPATLGPGGSFTFTLTFSPTAVGTFNDNLTVTAAPGTDGSPFTNTITGVATAGASLGFSPSAPITLPNTVATSTSPNVVVTLINNGVGDLTVTAIAMAIGTNFALNALPGLPLLLHPTNTVNFNINFTPNAVASFNDTINVTSTANSPAIAVQGQGVQITPIAIITLNQKKILMAFQTAAGVATIKMLLPFDLNNAQAGNIIFNGAVWDQPGQEKKLRRLEIFYENVGVGQITVTVSVLRPQLGVDTFDSQSKLVTLGTALADLTERSEFVDLQIAGEMIKLTFTRVASSGPMSLIGFIPHFEDAGEKMEGK